MRSQLISILKKIKSTKNWIHKFEQKLVVGSGFEPLKAEPADLQSAPIGRSGNPPNKELVSYFRKSRKQNFRFSSNFLGFLSKLIVLRWTILGSSIEESIEFGAFNLEETFRTFHA